MTWPFPTQPLPPYREPKGPRYPSDAEESPIMKTAILTLGLLAALSANADTFADTENLANGKIAILTDACTTGAGERRAYYYTGNGETEEGCWRYDGDTIIIQWERVGKRRYPISFFKLRGQYREFK